MDRNSANLPGALLIRPGDDTCWEDVVERTFFSGGSADLHG